MPVVDKYLTPDQVDAAKATSAQIANSGTLAVTPNKFVFFAAFDGTQNNRENPEFSKDKQSTNVGLMEQLVHDANVNNPNVKSGYYPGPGSSGNWAVSGANSALPTEQIKASVELAYKEFAENAKQWLAADPTRSPADITTAVTGFSRGGATAVVFAQILNERGLVAADGTELIKPGKVDVAAMLLFDPVSSWYSGNLAIPGNVNPYNITVIKSVNEDRFGYEVDDRSNDWRVNTFNWQGNHGDVGGFYDRGLGALSLRGGVGFFNKVGIATAETPVSRTFDENAPVAKHTESVDENGFVKWSGYDTPDVRETKKIAPPILTSDPTIQSIVTTPNSGNDPNDLTSTRTTSYKDGRVIQELMDADKHVVLSAQAGETLSRDTVTGAYRMVNPDTQVTRSYDPATQEFTYTSPSQGSIVIDKDGALLRLIPPANPSAEPVVEIDNVSYKTAPNGQLYRETDDGNIMLRDPMLHQGVLAEDGLGGTLTPVGYFYTDNKTGSELTTNLGGIVVSLKQTDFLYDDSELRRIETITTAAGTNRNVYVGDTLVSSQPIASAGPSNAELSQAASIANDLLNFTQTLKGNSPDVYKFASGLVLLNKTLDASNPGAFPNFGTASQVAQGALSVYALDRAFSSGGNDLGKLNATLNSVNFANIAINGSTTFAANTVGSSLNTALNGTGLANGSVGALPAIGLVLSIKSGDAVGIAQSLVTLFNPALISTGAGLTPLGWAFMAYNVGKLLFAPAPPKAWGLSSVSYGDGLGNTTLKINTTGESFGTQRTQSGMQSTLDYLQQQVINPYNSTHSADQQLGLIAQRLPSVAWRASDAGDPGYKLTDIDPLTGEQRYPYRRFDDNGMPFSSNPSAYQVDPTDPNQRGNLNQAMVMSAYNRQAIAPMWEVTTAKLQSNIGDPNAGLSEEERAAKAGLLAPLDTAYAAAHKTDPNAANKRTSSFITVGLDLDASGSISTTTVAQNASKNGGAGLTFDWDKQGYQKQVGWVSANDGMLVLDRDFNHSADNGGELLSNPLIADAAKGLRSLATWDSNGDRCVRNNSQNRSCLRSIHKHCKSIQCLKTGRFERSWRGGGASKAGGNTAPSFDLHSANQFVPPISA